MHLFVPLRHRHFDSLAWYLIPPLLSLKTFTIVHVLIYLVIFIIKIVKTLWRSVNWLAKTLLIL